MYKCMKKGSLISGNPLILVYNQYGKDVRDLCMKTVSKNVIIPLLFTMTCSATALAADSDSLWSQATTLAGTIGSTVSQAADAAQTYGPAISVAKKVWDAQSLQGLKDGKISVPDEAINTAIASQIEGSDKVKSLSVTSKENGRLDIHANVASIGRVELSGTVDAFVHEGDSSYMTYTIKERSLKDHKVASWIFSRISLAMAEKLVGPIKISDDMPVTVKGNSVTIDCSQALKKSELTQASVDGYTLLDALRIEKAVPHDGYIEITTSLNVPEAVKDLL